MAQPFHASSDSPRSSYHHGDARNALLTAAGELLEQTGAAGLSLRQVAERAGLSRQAPYNHFADKAALLAELVADGFGRLRDAMSAAEGTGPAPRTGSGARGWPISLSPSRGPPCSG